MTGISFSHSCVAMQHGARPAGASAAASRCFWRRRGLCAAGEGGDAGEQLRGILAAMRSPPKASVCEEARVLATRRLPPVIGRSFKWKPRGSMFSRHYDHVSDIDLHYFRKMEIGREVVEAIIAQRSRLGIVSFSLLRHCTGQGSGQEDVELSWEVYASDRDAFWAPALSCAAELCVKPFGADSSAEELGIAEPLAAPPVGLGSGGASGGLRAVVLTGVVRVCGGWMVPLDLTLSSEEEYSEPVPSRLLKLARNVERGKAWKALQRLRALLGVLRPQKGRLFLRQQIAEDINAELGHLRFLMIQLELLERGEAGALAGPDADVGALASSYLVDRDLFAAQLALPRDPPPGELLRLCRAELGRRSDALWLKYRDRVAESLWHEKYSRHVAFGELVPLSSSLAAGG